MENKSLPRLRYGLLTICAFLLAASLFLVGCRGPLQSGDTAGNEAEPGTLSLTINRHSTARTILPDWPQDLDSLVYRLEFFAVGNGGELAFYRVWRGSGIVELEVYVGIWDLVVTASTPYGDIARGEQRINMPSAGIVRYDIDLRPIATGTGTFRWDIRFPENVVSAWMEITRLGDYDDRDGLDPQIIYFFGGSEPLGTLSLVDGVRQNLGTYQMPAGEYRVLFSLYRNPGDPNERAMRHTVMRIYQNMESRFYGVRALFTDEHFLSRTLLQIVLDAWDEAENEWDFAFQGILAGHFPVLGIQGITDGNFNDTEGTGIIYWFNAVSADKPVPTDLQGLKALVDAALIGIGRDSIAAGDHQDTDEAALAIRRLAQNLYPGWDLEDWVYVYWVSDNLARVTVGGIYVLDIEFPLASLPYQITINLVPFHAMGVVTLPEPIVLRGDPGDPITITVDNHLNYLEGSIRWFAGGNEITGNSVADYGRTLILDYRIHDNRIGTHSMTVEARRIGGALYSLTVNFRVEL